MLTALLGVGVAQEGWTHTLAPAFAAPFDFLLLPWPQESVESVDVTECWRDEAPPFLGADWQFWCYSVPGDAATAADTVEAAATDAGLLRTPVYEGVGWLPRGDGEHARGGMRNSERTFEAKYYTFQYDGQAFVGLAALGSL